MILHKAKVIREKKTDYNVVYETISSPVGTQLEFITHHLSRHGDKLRFDRLFAGNMFPRMGDETVGPWHHFEISTDRVTEKNRHMQGPSFSLDLHDAMILRECLNKFIAAHPDNAEKTLEEAQQRFPETLKKLDQ